MAPTGPQQFEAVNFRGFFIRHRNFLGELTRKDGPILDFAFWVIGENVVRLKSRNFEHRFLRHRDLRLRLDGANDPNPHLFVDDSRFRIRNPGLAAGLPEGRGGISFESVNIPGHFIRHRNFHLILSPRNSPNLALDATFRMSNAEVPI